MKRLLITTALPQTREFTKVHTLLGKWCLCEESQSLAPIIPYHWDDRALLMCDYKSLDSLYEKILIELSGVMNEVHGERNSVHYWRILLGPWLGYIIQISYDRWKSIEVASNSDVEYRTKVIDIDIDKLIPTNFDEFNKVINSDLWNHYIYGKILNEFKNIEIFPVKDILVTEQAQSQRVGPSMNSLNWKHKLHAYFEKKLSALMHEFGEASFSSQPGEMPEKSLIVADGELQVLTDKDYIFKYGLYLKLDDKLTPQISAVKAKNWLQSGTAYNDYIAINVFRFSSIE